MSNKRIWIISEYYYPIVTSTGYYMTEIAEYLAKKNLEVHVICTGAKYNETSDYRIAKEENHNGVAIHRVITRNIDKNNFLKRAIRLLISSIRLLFKILISVHKGDELLVVTNPAFLLLFMPLVKRLKRVEYKLLVHDIFPENLVAIGKMNESSIVYKCIKKLFDRAYAQADICISIGRDMTEVIKQKNNKELNIVLIPNWSDNDDVYPLEKTDSKMYKTLGLDDKFVFQFAGNLGHAQGLDNILEAINLVKIPFLHFLFIGGGAKYNSIKQFAEQNKNVSLVGFQSRSEQNDFLNACDIAIVTLSDGMYGLGVPSKSYNIMAAGKPILLVGEKQSEIGRCLKEYNIGWLVEPNNPQALKDTFELIYERRNELLSIKNKSRQVACSIFAKEIILEKYYQLFC